MPVRHETHPADLTVTADPGRLAQLVANLRRQRRAAQPAAGRGAGESPAAVDDDTWWLEVCDDGPGIPADRVERVFDRFGSGGDSGGGTGLGLAIASWVCELHGGTITALPTPTGTTGAHLRAVLPRRARAGRPTHLQEDRTVPHRVRRPTSPTIPGPPRAAARPPRPTPAAVAPRPAGPAGGGGAARRTLAREGRAGAAAGRAGGAGHRRLGGPDLARAQRRPRVHPHPARRRPAHVGRRPAPPQPVDHRLRRAAALLASTR